jgi:multisubunit Na+/H+ antiporter MnhG subunit
MTRESLEDFNEVCSEAGDSLVAAVVLLIGGIFTFIISAAVIRMIGDIGRLSVDGNSVILSAALITSAVLLASVLISD